MTAADPAGVRNGDRSRTAPGAGTVTAADPPPGYHQVVWFELWVPDVERARQFYGALFGWTFRSMPEYDAQYWLIEGSGGVGGAILPGDGPVPGLRTGTVVYLAVSDLTEATDRCVALGGSVEQGVTAIGDGTYFTLVRDPFGTRLGLWSRSATST